MEHPGRDRSRTPADGRTSSTMTRRVRASAPARWYARLGRRGQAAVEIGLGTVAPPVVGLCVYVLVAWSPAQGALELWVWVLFASLLGTAFLIAIETARAFRFPTPPMAQPVEPLDLPRVATVVAAYLPNEQATIVESLHAHLAIDYPRDRHLVVLAYNTPVPLMVERELQELADREPRLLVVEAAGSTSKVENLEVAMELLRGHVDVVGVFDADHHPHPSCARRAAQWLADAAGEDRYDVVQGQCAIRNDRDTFVTRTVAAEFATLYAVAHPGRTVTHDFGLFGGSNGWWRADVLDELGLDGRMLTEDIDVSMRALDEGRRLAMDPRILSYELAPTDWSGWWKQRTRWAQGWHEVSLRHCAALLLNRRLSLVQRRGVAFLLAWRAVHPFLATQLVPLVIAMAWATDRRVVWDLLFFIVAAIGVNGVPVLQAVAANRLAAPGIGARPRLFARYVLVSVLGYAELRMSVTRGAVVRHLLGAHSWDVTARTSQVPAAGADPAPVEHRRDLEVAL